MSDPKTSPAAPQQCPRSNVCAYDAGHPGDCRPWCGSGHSEADVWQRRRDHAAADDAWSIEVDLARHQLRAALARIRQEVRTADRHLAKLDRLADTEVEGHVRASLSNALGMTDTGACAALFLAPEPDRKCSDA